ncbi:hypothetical protein ABK040_002272 [Willaertia magna]
MKEELNLSELEEEEVIELEELGHANGFDQNKPLLLTEDKQQSPKEIGGNYGTTFYWFSSLHYFFLDSLFLKVFNKKRKDIKDSDLLSMNDIPEKYVMNEKDKANHCESKFISFWNKITFNKNNSRKLLNCLFQMNGTNLFLSIFLGIIHELILLLIPFLLQHFLDYLMNNKNDFMIYFYCFLISFLPGISQLYFLLVSNRLAVIVICKFLSALRSVTFRKMIQVNDTFKLNEKKQDNVVTQLLEDKDNGEDNDGNAQKEEEQTNTQNNTGFIINLMSADINNVERGIMCITRVIPTTISLLLASILIIYFFTWSGAIGIFIVIFSALGGSYSNKFLSEIQLKFMEFKDSRLKLLSELFDGIRLVKFYGWERKFEENIKEIRDKEVEQLRKESIIISIQDFIGDSVITISSIITFVGFIIMGNELTSQLVFSSLILYSICQDSLIDLPQRIQAIIGGYNSLNRIEGFLTLDDCKLLLENSMEENDKEILSFKDVVFTWNNCDRRQLNNNIFQLEIPSVSIDANSNSFICVSGPVGSGKTSLLRAILGDLHLVEGSFKNNVKHNISYCSQHAFILNGTLRENILFGLPFNEERYQKVLKVCQLEYDLKLLPNGDLTEVGLVTLSGGQKARVSLARACYSKSKLILLDDVLSAVDQNVQTALVNDCLLNFLKDRTVLLCTHFKHVTKLADKVIKLENGKVTYFGIPEEKEMNNNIILPTVVDNDSLNQSKVTELTNNDTNNGNIENINEKEKIGNEEKGILFVEEDKNVGSISWSTYFFYLKNIGPLLVIILIISTPLSRILPLITNRYLAQFITILTTTTTNKEEISIASHTFIYLTLGITACIISLIFVFTIYFSNLNAVKNMHEKLTSSILYARLLFFDQNPSGRILNRFSSDIQMLEGMMGYCFFFFLITSCQSLMILIMITFELPFFLIIIPILVILLVLLQQIFNTTSREIERLESMSNSPLFDYFQNCLKGSSIIRAFNCQNYFNEQFQQKVDNQIKIYKLRWLSNFWFTSRMEILGSLVVFSSSLIAIFSKDTIPISLIGFCLQNALRISILLRVSVFAYSRVDNVMIHCERIQQYCENVQSEQDYANQCHGTNFKQITTKSPLQQLSKIITIIKRRKDGKIDFIHYSTSYRSDLDPVLKDINITIEEGMKIGIVGRTGAGKSTLTLSLFRFIEPIEGTIKIDDIDICNLSLQQLRNQITIIPQDPTLFSGTLRFNLDPFNEFDDFQIIQALQKVKLTKLTNDLSLQIENQFSLGEKQLLCLARGILHSSSIIILDEATATIDFETEKLIQETIKEQFKEATVLIIAHRLHTLVNHVDKVLVLESGKVKAFEEPNKVLKVEEKGDVISLLL